MKLRLIQIGKTKDQWLTEALGEYLKRLAPYGGLVVTELANKLSRSAENAALIKQSEAAAIAAVLDPNDFNVALDEHGKSFSSLEFAAFLDKNSLKRISFIIGGVYGLHPEVIKQCDYCLSLSAMTLTHQMVRLLLVEQLYRAAMILNHRPYHY